MSVREHDWMGQILGVSAPWQVTDVRLLPNTGIVSVQIEQPESGSRFWLGRRNSVPVRRMRWDHIGLAGHRCEIQLLLRHDQKAPEASWTGEQDLPFTRGLTRLVQAMLHDGVSMSQLCRMLELPFSDLWKYKYRLDASEGARPGAAPRTTAQPAQPTQPATVAPVTAAAPAAQAPAAGGATPQAAVKPAATPGVDIQLDVGPTLPPAHSPVWMQIIRGRLVLDVQALSLKLLLAKTLREAQSHNDPDLHAQAAQALHRYFERNQPVLGHETHQLAQAHQQQQAHPAAQADSLPGLNDPRWMALLLGERDLDVRALGLRLLLSRLRGQARSLQDQETRMTKLEELHRFFEKNQAVLRHEISQLQHWAMH